MVSENPSESVDNSYIVVLRNAFPQTATQNHCNFLQEDHASDLLLYDRIRPPPATHTAAFLLYEVGVDLCPTLCRRSTHCAHMTYLYDR